MSNLFLQEVEATVMCFDMKGFSVLSAQLGPVDLGIALSRYYEFASDAILGQGGRVIKFAGDGVLGVFGGTGVKDHRVAGITCVREAINGKRGWLEQNAEQKLPVMDFTVGLASGAVLLGDIGTAKLRMFDALGEPVTVANRLNTLASGRQLSHLITAETFEPAKAKFSGVEVEPAEIGRRRWRLFKLDLE